MKILVIKPSSLGDIIHALPFLNILKETWPDSEVDWVISRNLKGILEDNPLINELITIDKDSWKNVKNIPATLSEISALKTYLSSKHYDIAIDLQGLLRSGVIAFFSKAKKKVGFSDAREGGRFFYDKKVTVKNPIHAVDKCIEAAKIIDAKTRTVKFPLYVDSNAKTKVADLLGKVNEYILIVPSARWLSKRWPVENFASLINKIPLTSVITGGRSDGNIAGEIIKTVPSEKVLDLCGKTDLKELSALIDGAKAVVTNDTGPMHIAAALNKPVVAIFGPTDPLKTGPYNWQKENNLNVIRANVSCSPCRKKTCRDLICMKQVSVDEVYMVLKEYI